ncbi:MAG: amino acid permease [Acidimicrobiia bacterium]|nr:amino acid permease [Acidimicrobiia bacterium]
MSIGIGGMIGGGIFAVLGLAASVGEGGTYIAFLVAGIVALLTSYSYVKLSVAIPSQGGTVDFITKGFPNRTIAGSLNTMLWLAYIVTIALYAFAFGSYGSAMFGDSSGLTHLLITASILSMMFLNVLSPALIGKTETLIVALKLTILVGFTAYALFFYDGTQLGNSAPAHWAPIGSIISGGMLIFIAYEGFELIANSAPNIDNPTRTLPRAYYLSLLITIVLYMAVAVVVVGLLSIGEIIKAEDFALAEAARVVWGSIGFNLIVIAALASTASAINATLFGTSRLTVELAIDGEVPSVLERKVAGRPILGLLLTGSVAIVIANVVPLTAISTTASAAFLTIFAFTNWSATKMAHQIGARRSICASAAVGCLLALISLLVHAATEDIVSVYLFLGLLVCSYAGEATYQARRQAHARRANSPKR